jgi:hypothetical protein
MLNIRSTQHAPGSSEGSQCGIPASASCRSPFPSSAECDKRPVPKELIGNFTLRDAPFRGLALFVTDQRRHTLPGGVAMHWTCVCCKKEYERTMIQQWEIFYLLNGTLIQLRSGFEASNALKEEP